MLDWCDGSKCHSGCPQSSEGSIGRWNMRYFSRHYFGLLIPALLLFAAIEAKGQAIQSTILGKVTDPSGAAVSGATVIVKNEGTNIERTMATDENGDYRV